MSGSSFFDGYKHPKWQKKRLTVMSASGFMCEACGCEDSPLHVHHKAYAKGVEVYESKETDLEVLCQKCHNRVENMVRRVRECGGAMIRIAGNGGELTPLERIIEVLSMRTDGGVGEYLSMIERLYTPFSDAMIESLTNQAGDPE